MNKKREILNESIATHQKAIDKAQKELTALDEPNLEHGEIRQFEVGQSIDMGSIRMKLTGDKVIIATNYEGGSTVVAMTMEESIEIHQKHGRLNAAAKRIEEKQ